MTILKSLKRSLVLGLFLSLVFTSCDDNANTDENKSDNTDINNGGGENGSGSGENGSGSSENGGDDKDKPGVVVTSCTANQKRCICSQNETTGEMTCKESPATSSELSEDEVCLDVSSDRMCGMTKCEEFKGKEVCGIGLKCKNVKANEAAEDDYQCVCSDGTVKYDNRCVNKYEPETCGIDESLNFIKCVTDENGNTQEGAACNGKMCVCTSPFVRCDDSKDGSGCRNLLNDKDNCGACGNVCNEDEACIDGECKCDNGFVVCDGKCIDPSKDAEHCGAAGSCSEKFKEGGDNSNFKGFVCFDGYSSGCFDGKCSCIENYIAINGACINPSNNDLYCGAKSQDDKGQNCLDIEGAYCKSKVCTCINGSDPVYNKEGLLEKCVDVRTNTEYCGFGTEAGEYMNCLEACNGSNADTCNPEYKGKENQPWSCIPINDGADFIGQCKPKCPENTLTCKNSMGNLVCVDKLNVKYLDKANNICACSTCDDDNDPTNGCTDFNIGESIDHCTACNTPCAAPFNTCSKKESGGLDSYECTCGEGEKIISIGGASYCLNKDVAHIEQKEDGEWGCSGFYVDNNGDWSDGCEFDSSNDPNSCGVSLKDCYSENVQGASCKGGICSIELCAQNFDNCNSDSSDGCEADLTNDIKNCKFCGNQCNLKCRDDSCENRCESGNCCIIGELDKNYAEKDFACCSGTKKYKYNYSFLYGCFSSSHYGCFEKSPESQCWELVEE